MDFNGKVEFHGQAVFEKIKRNVGIVQAKLDAQVLKDSNYYCPMDSGTLQKSAIISSRLGSGVLVWNTPYAKKQYYGCPNKSKDKNPNASQKWFEVAKSKKLKEWEKLINDEYIKNDQ